MAASFGVTQQQLADEAAARAAADTAEATARAAADTAEASARAAADTALDARVDAVEAGGPVANLARFSSGNPANTLISAVDGSPVLAGSGVPDGGTTGQVLKKNSNTNGDAGWADGASAPLIINAGAMGTGYNVNAQNRDRVVLLGTLTANCSITFSNLLPGTIVDMALTQDATGGRTITLPFGTFQPTASLVLSSQPGRLDLVHCLSPDGAYVIAYVDSLGNTERIQNPATIANLAEWWSAADLVGNDGDTIGGTIVNWVGKQGKIATQSTSGSRPVLRKTTNGINGQPAVQFDGTDDFLTTDLAYARHPLTVVMVLHSTALGSQKYLLEADGNRTSFSTSAAGQMRIGTLPGLNIAQSDTNGLTTNPAIIAWTLGSTGAYSMWINGLMISAGINTNGQFASLDGGAGTWRIASSTGSVAPTMKLGELLIYNRVLGAAELRSIFATFA